MNNIGRIHFNNERDRKLAQLIAEIYRLDLILFNRIRSASEKNGELVMEWEGGELTPMQATLIQSLWKGIYPESNQIEHWHER